MFPFPSSPTPSQGRGRSPDAASEDRGKIVILAVGLLLCLALMGGLYAFLRTGPAPAPVPAEGDPAGAPARAPVEIQAVGLFPEDQAEEIQKDVLEKAGEWKVADGVPAVDPEPFEVLVSMATLEPRVLNLLPEGFDREPDVARILADPGSFRGKAIAVLGELLSLEKVPWEGRGRQVQELRRGVLRDAKGRLFSFTWPVANPLEPDAVEPGRKDWARVQGLFYKTWPAADPASPGKTEPTLHLVLQRHPERSFPPLQVKEIDPAWMDQVHDADAGEMLRTDDEPFYYLLNLVKGLGPEGFEGWLRAKQEAAPAGSRIFPPEDFTGRYKVLLDHPSLYRFKPVNYTGFLLRPQEQVPPPNPGNMEKVYSGFLVDADFAPAVWIFSPRSFTAQGFKAEDRVHVEGIFYKRVAYQAQGGGPLRQAVVILAGKVTPAPLGKSVGTDLLWVIVALMVVVATGVGFLLFRSRREDRMAEESRRQRHARRRVSTDAAGKPAPAAGDGPPA